MRNRAALDDCREGVMSTTTTTTTTSLPTADLSSTRSPLADYTKLQPHPLADLLPAMSEEEFEALTDDIKANGLRVPIVTYVGQILDGRHRYKAAMEAKITLTEKDVVEFKPTGRDTPLKFVIGQNVNRRHLNESQRAVIAANIANIEKGGNRFSIADGSIDLSTAAKMLNVGEATVKRAKTFLDKAAPQLVEQVREGTMRVSALSRKELNKPHADQIKLIEAKANAKESAPESTPLTRLIKAWTEAEPMQKEEFVDQEFNEISAIVKRKKAA
jgi:ParB-like chromosome segregation protein Spo0J